MNAITANQLKTKGISVIEDGLSKNHELIITVRGKEKYIIMDMEQYHYLRECELDAALHQAKRDYQDGNFVTESVEDHIKRISHDV
jgi:PHD/YefM family antitoxin component YafN of YafNO toxin-antitoxin module